VIPEISRDYHAGVLGTFMDTITHNRYFGSIAMQSDTRFTWDTPEGSDSISHLLQSSYDAELIALISDKSTIHLKTLDDIRQFTNGIGVVWYSCPINIPDHTHMRGIAAFFGIWHEGARGSRNGIHEIWWLGNARLILINICSHESELLTGPIPIIGSIECATSTVRNLMPINHQPISWQLFQDPGAHPRLQHHVSNFGTL
jgi:hypothetical protein